MHITVYSRCYPVAGAPVFLSLVPHSAGQRHTYTAAGRVYKAELGEVRVVVPDDAKVDPSANLLRWAGGSGPMKANATEVLGLAEAGEPGFRPAK